MNVENFDFEQEFEKIKRKILKPNILLCGATGVGKSSVINTMFGKKVASVGEGKPITRGIHEYKGNELDVTLYDSEGYEIGSEAQSSFKKNIVGFIDKRIKSSDSIDRQIHLVWYCISTGNKRITDLDIETIHELRLKGIKVAVLLTQIDSVDEEELNAMIRQHEESLIDIDYFRLSVYKDTVPAEYLDWDKLINWSLENLDESLQSGFIRALHGELHKKKQLVNKSIVPKYTASASGVALSPIPMSDAALLVPIQVTMTMHIMHIYEIELGAATVKSLVGSTTVSNMGKAAARILFANIIKLVPGLGTVAGGAINAVVASTFTMAMGYTMSELSYRYIKKVYAGEQPDILDIFTNEEITRLVTQFFKSSKAGSWGK